MDRHPAERREDKSGAAGRGDGQVLFEHLPQGRWEGDPALGMGLCRPELQAAVYVLEGLPDRDRAMEEVHVRAPEPR